LLRGLQSTKLEAATGPNLATYPVSRSVDAW
jgi:hypothetical protein